MTQPRLTRENRRLVLSGPVNVGTVTPLLSQLPALLAGGEGETLEVDCADMTAADSSAIGLLVEMHRQAAGTGQTLQVRGIEDQMINLIRLYGVDWILD